MKDWQEQIGTSFSFAPRSDELNTTWKQVATAVKDGSWKAIYAADDAEFDAIVADMTAQAKAYGYDECIEFTLMQAELRKAAEDAAKSEKQGRTNSPGQCGSSVTLVRGSRGGLKAPLRGLGQRPSVTNPA